MEELAIYIHWPFCELKCPYCDFNSHVVAEFQENRMLECYKRELDFLLEKLNEKRRLRSVFFGGGTPSLMKPETVAGILEYIFSRRQLIVSRETKVGAEQTVEVTLEANPSSSELLKFRGFRDAGVNRLSLGVQSLYEPNLKFLGRKHSASEALRAIEMARETFENYSFDLMYALEGQTLSRWEAELRMALQKLAGGHISLYTLTIEKGTKFFKWHKEGKFLLPPNEEDFYILTNDITKSYGFERYEVSNYAREGMECRHNVAYWQGVDYLGIGAGAHGRLRIGGQRFATQNFAEPRKYIESVEASCNALQVYEELSEEAQVKEALLMNLRYRKGISLEGLDVMKYINFRKFQQFKAEGMLQESENGFFLTPKGLNVANSIICTIML